MDEQLETLKLYISNEEYLAISNEEIKLRHIEKQLGIEIILDEDYIKIIGRNIEDCLNGKRALMEQVLNTRKYKIDKANLKLDFSKLRNDTSSDDNKNEIDNRIQQEKIKFCLEQEYYFDRRSRDILEIFFNNNFVELMNNSFYYNLYKNECLQKYACKQKLVELGHYS